MQTVERVWGWLSGRTFLAGVVIVLALISLLTLLIPQAPVLPGESAAFYRWLAEARLLLNGYDELLLRSGALWLRSSLWMRVALAALVLAIAARADALRAGWAMLPPRGRWRVLVSCGGGALLIVGWVMQISWGWQTVETLSWPGEPLVIVERGLTLPLSSRALTLWTGRYGLYVLPHGDGLGLEITARDSDDNPLELLTTSRGEGQQVLRLALTNHTPDAYYAQPAMGLVFRAVLEPAASPPQALMQIYRVASGELVAEKLVESSSLILTEEMHLAMHPYPLWRPRVVYNPGAPLQGIGLTLLLLSVWLELRSAACSLDSELTPAEISTDVNGEQ